MKVATLFVSVMACPWDSGDPDIVKTCKGCGAVLAYGLTSKTFCLGIVDSGCCTKSGKTVYQVLQFCDGTTAVVVVLARTV